MKVFVKGIGMIAPYDFMGESATAHTDDKLTCKEPDYNQYFDNKTLRRFSRIVKMGATAAKMALAEAQVEMPDGIIVGTGFGCLEDTGTFLRKMTLNKEAMLNPTPFIFSTHNTIASQVAILIQSNGYNITYSHRNFSFENALSDAMLLLKENEVKDVLVGGIDELTDDSYSLLKKSGYYNNNRAGEGAAFFVLSTEESGINYAEIKSLQTFSDLSPEEISSKAAELSLEYKIGTIITGGEKMKSTAYDKAVMDAVNPPNGSVFYKQLSGEYPTASAYALALSADILKNKRSEDLLIYNHYGQNHSFILLSSC